jgi:GNAT superfamily N-acetyltransferase
MSTITYYQATELDIPALASLRIAFISELQGKPEAEVTERLRTSLSHFFRKAFQDRSYIAWLARDEDEIVSVGGMALWTLPGNFINHEGRKGYIMNMYTVPTHRRRGLCSQILTRLTDTARAMGVHSFELHATAEGERVYVKNGFKLHDQPTYRKHYF